MFITTDDYLTSVALSGNVEIAVLVLREPLEPFHQESVGIVGCFVVAVGVKLGAGVGVGEPHAGRRVQEQDVRRCSDASTTTRTKMINLDHHHQSIINKATYVRQQRYIYTCVPSVLVEE